MSENIKLVPKRRFKEFQTAGEWKQRKLLELSNFITKGATPTTYGFKWEVDGIPFFRNDSIKDNRFIFGEFSYISDEANTALIRSEIRGGDILVAITGDIGKVGIVPISIEKANINQHMAKVRIEKEAYPYFVYQFLSTDQMQEKYKSIKTGISMPQLSLEQIRDIDIKLPSIEEQKKIGTYFQVLDNLITLHQRKLEKMKALKSAYLSEMFPAEGEREPKRRFAGFTGAWEQRKVGEVTDLLTGFPFESASFSEEGIKLIRGMNVKRCYLDFSDDICEHWNTSEGLESYLLEAEDILIQMDGALIGKSYAKIKENQLPALLVQRVTRTRAKKNISNADFIYHYIQRDFLEYIKRNKTESAVPHLSLNDIRDFEIMLPSIDEQEKIGECFAHFENLIILHQRKLEKLQNIKQAYLNEMFL